MTPRRPDRLPQQARRPKSAETILQDRGKRGIGHFGTHGGEPESWFEEAVSRALQNNGFAVVGHVGSSGFEIDLAVFDPHHEGQFLPVVKRAWSDRTRDSKPALPGKPISVQRFEAVLELPPDRTPYVESSFDLGQEARGHCY